MADRAAQAILLTEPGGMLREHQGNGRYEYHRGHSRLGSPHTVRV